MLNLRFSGIASRRKNLRTGNYQCVLPALPFLLSSLKCALPNTQPCLHSYIATYHNQANVTYLWVVSLEDVDHSGCSVGDEGLTHIGRGLIKF